MSIQNQHSPLHIIGVSFSTFTRSLLLLCEELSLDYELSFTYKGTQYAPRTPEIKTLNPFAKFPILLVDGKPLYETQSILRFLDNQYNSGKLQGENLWEKAQIDQWCSAISVYIDKAIVRDYLLEFLFPKGENGAVDTENVNRAIPKLSEVIQQLEDQLADNPWICGKHKTLADFLLGPSLFYLVFGPNNETLLQENSPLRHYVARWLATNSGKKMLVSAQR